MTILNKTLQYENNDFLIYQHYINNTNNEEVLYLANADNVDIHPTVRVGYYDGTPVSGDPSISEGYYSVILLTNLGIARDKLISCNVKVQFGSLSSVGGSYIYDLTQNLNDNYDITLNIKPFATNSNNYTLNEYRNADKTSNVITDFVPSGILYKTYNLTIPIKELNAASTWNSNTYAAIHFNTSLSSLGLRDISIEFIDLVYQASKPSVPLNPVASGMDSSAYLTWSPPANNGGDSVTNYVVRYTNITTDIFDTITTTSNASNLLLTNLTNDDDYVFRVAAVNNMGTGNFSIESNVFTPQFIPKLSSLNYNDANYTRIRLRRDSSANWSGVNPILALGEAGFETDTRFLKVGNNIDTWNNLDYIKVPNSSISFPNPPSIILPIGDSSLINNPRINCNLSNNELLNIIGDEGIDIAYFSNSNSVRISLDKLFSPFNSGTLAGPNSLGRPGEVYYDEQYMYICVQTNVWKKILLDTNYWFNPNSISISNNSGTYPSITNIVTSGSYINYISDGDPYPAKASSNMVNDGVSTRSTFINNNAIIDQNYNFSFIYRGGFDYSNPEISISGYNGIMNNGCLVSAPTANNDAIGAYSVPSGFNFNRTFFANFFSIDDCGGYVDSSGIYAYYNGRFLNNCWNDPKVYNSNVYYQSSNYNQDYFRHSDGHSKILGFCFDGYPIYGPFGYSDGSNKNSQIILLTSSYLVYDNDNHRPDNWKYTNSITVNNFNYILTGGAFIQDFYYAQNSGVLDQYNGRYTITPDFPNGTYAYFLTFTDETLIIPKYPYIIGNYSYNTKFKV